MVIADVWDVNPVDTAVAVSLWDWKRRECVGRIFESGGYPPGMGLSPDGKRVALSIHSIPPEGAENTLVIATDTGAVQCSLPLSGAVSFSPGGEYLAVVGQDESAVVEVPSCRILRPMGPHGWHVAVSPLWDLVAVWNRTGVLQLWSLQDDTVLWQSSLPMPLAFLAFSPDGRFLAGGARVAWNRRRRLLCTFGVYRARSRGGERVSPVGQREGGFDTVAAPHMPPDEGHESA